MIRKLWVKFDNLDVVCVCNKNNRKCDDSSCEEYVVKFTPTKRITERRISKSPRQLEDKKRRLSSEISKPINDDNIKDLIKRGR